MALTAVAFVPIGVGVVVGIVVSSPEANVGVSVGSGVAVGMVAGLVVAGLAGVLTGAVGTLVAAEGADDRLLHAASEKRSASKSRTGRKKGLDFIQQLSVGFKHSRGLSKRVRVLKEYSNRRIESQIGVLWDVSSLTMSTDLTDWPTFKRQFPRVVARVAAAVR